MDLPPRIPDVTIVNIDLEHTRHSELGPDRRVISFKLSLRPPPGWARLFAQARKQPRRSCWRPAVVNGAYIVTDCIPEEIAEWHLEDLKQDVKTANEKYRAYCVEVEARERGQAEGKLSEQERLHRLKRELRFD
jgi:hypothetical protein